MSSPAAPSGDDARAAAPGPSRGILPLSLPIVISFGLRSIYGLVDTAYAAMLEGLEDASVAAIGFTIPLEFLMTACWVGTSNGLTGQLSAAIGARQGSRVEALKRSAMRIQIALLFLFLLVAAAVWLTADQLGLEPEVGRQLRTYATVLMGGSALVAFWSVLPDSLVKAHHDTKSTMWAGIISGGANVVLNTVFVFGFGMGIFGIALSTVLARTFSLAYALRRAAHHERLRRDSGHHDEPWAGARPTREILFIAIPSSITFLLMAFESLALNWIVKQSPDSTSAIAAWSIFDRAARFCAMPLIAIGVAMLPLVARLYGQGDYAGIRRQIRVAGLFGVAYLVLIVTPLVFLFGEELAHFFTKAPEARALSSAAIFWVPIATLAIAPFFPMRAAFEGMALPRPGLVVSVVRTLVLAIPLSWFGMRAAEGLGHEPVLGVYVGSTLAGLCASVWMVLWMRALLSARIGERIGARA